MSASVNTAPGVDTRPLLPDGPGENSLAGKSPLFSNNGFTLIELVVVLALISIVLYFVIPRFQNTVLDDSKKIITRWIMTTTRVLKVDAIKHQKRYVLHIDLDSGTLWTGSDPITDAELQKGPAKSLRLPDDLKFIDVEYPGREKVTTGQADIFFYKENYSQAAFIHMETDGYQYMTFQIEPFLPDVKRFDEYVGFEE